RDNLRWVAPAAQDEPIRRALQQAVAYAFVAEQPAGLDTVLGRAGHGLSGGQLRRLALARLFLLDPEVVLLDEPTAHLDAATAQQVLHNILAFCRGRTLIVATHDPNVAAAFGCRLVLPDGGWP
ncbi:ATP-binding cassette domain-containing protein, partial [Castellaniella sp.]|uniref:ATP-binding cassette domain-containing protein n=1 Tax=Castellaniella sp. TaxID=1955812 RepID=UPI003566889C